MASDRHITVTTPLGEGTLLFERMMGREGLGQLFEYEVDLLSKSSDIKVADVLGKTMTVNVRMLNEEQEPRIFNGIVTRFAQSGSEGDMTRYRATLRPWLWLLTRTTNCRTFQHGKTVVDIVQQVFRDAGFSDFDAGRLTAGNYRKWEFLVQYRETDFNFVSRILEQEGIYYYFTHSADKHMLVLADSHGSHDATPGYESVPFIPPDPSSTGRRRDHVDTWVFSQQVVPGKMFLDDYNFESPRGDRKSPMSSPREGAHANFEIYDYPGEFEDRDEGMVQSRLRLEGRQVEFETFDATGDARGLITGGLFTLTGHPRADQEKEYLITSATYALATNPYGSGGSGDVGPEYRCSFTAIDSQVPFRVPHATPKPVVQGPQTAIVVGQKGEEIWTDKYGRVKVQFHWDRYGASDENSSCWVRVAQVWAGSKWGAMHIPRIGQEVIVDFLEGDPDRPIVTGRVYNADNMPPYDLPANQTQSGIKSRSSKGGGPSNFNEIRFEDKKGSEELFVQAEKDHNITVKNNQSLSVGASRSKSVGADETVSVGTTRTETVGTDESITIGANQTISVGANQSLTVAANRDKTVGANETVTIGAASSETIGATREVTIAAAYQISVGGVMNESIGGAKAEEIGGLKSVNVGGLSSEDVGGPKSVNAGGNISETAGKDIVLKAGKNFSLNAADDIQAKAGKKTLIDVGDQLTIKCGSASIQLKKNGDIQIKGNKISIEASGDLKLKGSKIGEN
jgi:type VI secretion system secreted protein VgrG